jgi:hypothetical protein
MYSAVIQMLTIDNRQPPLKARTKRQLLRIARRSNASDVESYCLSKELCERERCYRRHKTPDFHERASRRESALNVKIATCLLLACIRGTSWLIEARRDKIRALIYRQVPCE